MIARLTIATATHARSCGRQDYNLQSNLGVIGKPIMMVADHQSDFVLPLLMLKMTFVMTMA
jgi:hypothetical protein